MTPFRTLLAVSLLAATCVSAQAAEFTVKMLNNGPGGMMVFDPAFTKVAPGDTVKFLATDKGHNVETIKNMAPEGVAPVKGALGKDETITFEKEGVYGFKCAPHYIMGMVAMVVVGSNLENLEKAKGLEQNKMAKQRFEPLWVKAEAK
ncbi:pseudoazurin [Methylobacterium gnaphalii]|uniref:Pseudoazurin n=1 Tax=Methylobacterium gnaphalii TaxID=1010610 RepID=A0A512JJC8_9HYPH|nr:pseudoazurin [Methylobacterium gnaphalii]GEP10068.1 pseudoazurin [Methylobacterium gnaphalii]GJD67667.1 Pseudoazurin [Methylobacterium gnaphalii]GLS48338.1 pseudoazurin [Methylobacterium gnaphalii]